MRRVPPILAIVALFVVFGPWVVRGQIPPEGGAAAYAADLATRRAALMSALGPDAVLILWSAPTRTYSADIDYPYRQDSNVFYLTGVAEEGTTLVLVPGASSTREVLFVRRPDATRELWYGHVMTSREVTSVSGIQTVFSGKDDTAFQPFMDALFGAVPDSRLPPGAATDFAPLFDAIRSGRAKLAIADPLPPAGQDPPRGSDAEAHLRWARAMLAKYPAVQLVSAEPMLKRQRQIKTVYEQRVLKKSAEISAAAHVAGMRMTRPGRWEYELKAAVEYQFLKSGALSWGYPSIVGSGPNATSLHYLAGTRRMVDGDMVLVDAAGSYQGLTADITRSYPVNGRFSRKQRAIYELVLKAQEAGIAAARPGVSADAVTDAIRRVFATGLRELGLVRAVAGPALDTEVGLWFPHLPIHGIGVDVHDPLGDLVPGTAFVIEPGLYFRADAFERLPLGPARAELEKELGPVAAGYRDIGIRIEDSFLMTDKGPVMLSSAAPRSLRDVERTIGKGR